MAWVTTWLVYQKCQCWADMQVQMDAIDTILPPVAALYNLSLEEQQMPLLEAGAV